MFTTGVTRTGPEKVFIQVKNGYSTASLTVGQLVCLSTTAADGVTVTRPATGNLTLLKGVVKDPTIAYGEYGEAQCYGYNDDALISGGTDVAAGDKLTAKNAVFNAIKATTTTAISSGESGLLIALQAFTTSTAAAKRVEIRCM